MLRAVSPGLLLFVLACGGAATPPPKQSTLGSGSLAKPANHDSPIAMPTPVARTASGLVATPTPMAPPASGPIATTTPVTRIARHSTVWDEHAYRKLSGRAKFPVDGKLERRFVFCEIDVTTPKLAASCHDSNAAEHQAHHPGELQTDPLWRWVAAAAVVSDVATDPALLASVQQAVEQSRLFTAHPGLLVMDQRTMALREEIVAYGCENAQGHPCDPIPKKTGRMLRVPFSTSMASFAGTMLSPSSPVAPQVLPLVGWRDDAYHLVLLMMYSTPDVHAARLNEATSSAAAARETLSYLERVEETNPDVRLALIFDSMLIAGHLADHDAFTRADAALQQELKQRKAQKLPVEFVTADALECAKPWFALVRNGHVQRVAPAHLELAIEHRPW